jgi:hypothetical protein
LIVEVARGAGFALESEHALVDDGQPEQAREARTVSEVVR